MSFGSFPVNFQSGFIVTHGNLQIEITTKRKLILRLQSEVCTLRSQSMIGTQGRNVELNNGLQNLVVLMKLYK